MSYGIAIYQCQECKHIFQHPPKMTQCPICSGIYCDWVNFDTWLGDYENHQKNQGIVDSRGIYSQKKGNLNLKNIPNFL